VTPANVHDSVPAQDLLARHIDAQVKPVSFGDSAYAGTDVLAALDEAGFEMNAKVPPAANRQGRFSKDDFIVNLDEATVTCPGDWEMPIRYRPDGTGTALFGEVCATCPIRDRCTTATAGRTITIHAREDILQAAKARQTEPDWQATYRATRPKVERKIAHFVRVRWGGRNARVRGVARIATDIDTRATAVNLARLATLGLRWTNGTWAGAPPRGGRPDHRLGPARLLVPGSGRPEIPKSIGRTATETENKPTQSVQRAPRSPTHPRPAFSPVPRPDYDRTLLARLFWCWGRGVAWVAGGCARGGCWWCCAGGGTGLAAPGHGDEVATVG
jgi:hypothetical protein